jgi:hypothetical protein
MVDSIANYLKDNGFVDAAEPAGNVANEDSEKKTQPKLKKALEFAHDIRKFEIELYWKRATYFWTLIASTLGGFILLLFADVTKLDASARDFRPVLIQLLISLGAIFSLAWFFVNKGSKFWQRNWEYHVDILEQEITGPLYKIVFSKHDDHAFKPHFAYHYSVTNINQWLSAIVFLIMFATSIIVFVGDIRSAVVTLHPDRIDWSKTLQFLVFASSLLAFLALYKFGRLKSAAKPDAPGKSQPEQSPPFDSRWDVAAQYSLRRINVHKRL